MKERPILFSGPMVRAILDGRKTQTRRVVKPQPIVWPDEYEKQWHPHAIPPGGSLPSEWSWWEGPHHGPSMYHRAKCPYGQPGDRLWVRETWAIDRCGRRVSLAPEAWPEGFPVDRVQYVATDAAPAEDGKGGAYWWNSRPSTHMPRWASRITLEVVSVRVERVQDISGEDAMDEGYGNDGCEGNSACSWFQRLWNSINAPRGFGWDANPWVWVVEFKRVKC